jgi:hypothetical protein
VPPVDEEPHAAIEPSVLVNVQGPAISKLNRFTEVDFSSANNDNGGYYNASNHPKAIGFKGSKGS